MASKEELAPHVEDISRALGSDIVKKQKIDIEKELREYLEIYRVKDISTAKRSIVKKYGGNPSELRMASGLIKTLAELQPNEPSVDFLCRILTLNPKEVEQDGVKKKIHYGILADQTASKSFTIWMGEPPFAKGDVVRVRNAYTREWNGEAQVSFGTRTTFEKEKPDALPATPAGRFGEPRNLKVKDFRDGENNVAVEARILTLERKEVTVGDATKPVFSGLLADETGRSQYTMWHEFPLKPGDAVRISGAYIKSWKGIPRLTFDERSKVETLERSKLPDMKELRAGAVLTIEEVAGRGGAADVTLRGIIIDVKPGSGLVLRCPECKRVVQKGVCRVHGTVKGTPDLRIKAALDDGTGALIAVLGKELTEKITGRKLEDYMRLVAELANPDAVRAEIMEKVIARPMEITGNVTADDYGLMLIASSARMVDFDVQAEARAMLEELEVG
jgi:replication factor A1